MVGFTLQSAEFRC